MHGRPGARQQCPHLGLDRRAPRCPFDKQREIIGVDARHARRVQAVGCHAVIGRAGVTDTEAQGQHLQDAIGGILAQGFVDPLESVDVDQHHRAMPTPDLLAQQGRLQRFAKVHTVGQAGQVVKIGQLPDTLLGRDALGNILQRALYLHHLTIGIAQRHRHFMGGAHLAIGPQNAVFQRVTLAIADAVERFADPFAIARMHPLNEGRQAFAKRGSVFAEQCAVVVGAMEAIGAQIPLPAADPCNFLRRTQIALAAQQAVDGVGGTQRIAHPVAQQRPVDRLGDEVGCATVVGQLDRCGVFQAGQHDDRHAHPLPAQTPAGFEAIDAGHQHIEQDQVGAEFTEAAQPGLAVGRFGHLESGLLERRAGEHARDVVVVNHQQARAPFNLGHEL